MESPETPDTVKAARERAEELADDTAEKATDTRDDLAGDTVDEVSGQLPLGLGRVVSMVAGRPTVPRLLAGAVIVFFVLGVGRKLRR